MTDQLPPFTQGDWVASTVFIPEGGIYVGSVRRLPIYAITNILGDSAADLRLVCFAPKLFRALCALAAVAKVESDAEYRAVLDARDVIAEVMGS